MKLLEAKFVGLKGIYSKSGKKEISIDFTKCIHNLIYIIGKNGSGKSTLMDALQPLPDSPQMYLDGEYGEKRIVYGKENYIYIVHIQYPVYANGGRAATKAFLTEITPEGQSIELNENGTINSYKDVLYSRFNMDPNFESLSHLSVENRGLVDRKPAERKKFIGSLLQSIEAYNDIYKTLTKRSSTVKAMINNITAKIDSIGDAEKLELDRVAAENRIATLQKQKQELEAQVAASQATINLMDPDNAIQSKYKELTLEAARITTMIEPVKANLSLQPTMEQAEEEYDKINQQYITISSEISSILEYISNTLLDREEEAKRLVIKNQKYSALVADTDITSLKNMIKEYRKRIFEYEKIFKKLGVSGDIITKDEYVLAIETLQDIVNEIDNIRSYATESNIEDACNYILNERDPYLVLNEYNFEEVQLKDIIKDNENEVRIYAELLTKVKILEQRPKCCNIDDCSFIADALAAKARNPEKALSNAQMLLEDSKEKQEDLYKRKYNIQEVIQVYDQLNSLLSTIKRSTNILNKFPNMERYIDQSIFIRRIVYGDAFNDIYDLSQQMDAANIFELYKNDKKVLQELESEYKIWEAQASVIDELKNEIDALIAKLAGIDTKIEEKQAIVDEKRGMLIKLESRKTDLETLIDTYKKLNELESRKEEINSQLASVSSNIERISTEINIINRSSSQLQSIVAELNPLMKKRDTMTFSLQRIAEYKQELDVYNERYSLIEMLKKYSSPTKGGIQTIFMQIYMDKTLALSNQLLSMLFDGDMEVLPYIINENEFRIPIKNAITNLVTDDISNCSTSERSMIAMIMSFALLVQSSSDYNIIKLDEIDGGLDQYNRSRFPEILHNIMDMLNVEHCLMISHASEADMSNVDIISLTPVSHEAIKGNVIFQL